MGTTGHTSTDSPSSAATTTDASSSGAPPTALRSVPTWAAVVAAVGLIVSGLLTTTGGAVRWAGCLTPSTVAGCESLHGDAATLASDQAAPLLAAGWLVLALVFLGLATHGVPRAAAAVLVASGVAAAALAVAAMPAEGSGVGGGRFGLVLVLGAPVVAGALLIAEGGRATTRSWWLGAALVVVGVGHSFLGWSLPHLWSASADDPVGLFLVSGVLTVVGGAVAVWGAAQRR